MSAFDPKTLGQWVAGHRAAERYTCRPMAPADSIRISLSFIEAIWPVACNDLTRRAHEEDAKPVRELWKKLAQRTGRLAVRKSDSKRSRR